MATLHIRTSDHEITLPDQTDEDLAILLEGIDQDFRDKGGFWFGGSLTREVDAVTSGTVVWVPNTSRVDAQFDADTPADRVLDLLPWRDKP